MSAIASVIHSLGRGTVPELAILLAMVGLFYLGRDLIATGSGQTPPIVLACVVVVALMISALAVYLHRSATGSRSDAENSETPQGPPESGDERAGPCKARRATRADRR